MSHSYTKVPDNDEEESRLQLHTGYVTSTFHNICGGSNDINEGTALTSDWTELNENNYDLALFVAMVEPFQQQLHTPQNQHRFTTTTTTNNNQQGSERLLAPLLSPSLSSSATASSLTDVPFDGVSGPSAPIRRLTPLTTLDGVFANISAKPEIGSRKDDDQRPPAYDSAVQDITPPYFEMAVDSPVVFDDEILVDVAVCFQFLGFLLTYLLHNSHASKAGSMVGLGITLLNFGIRMRGNLDSMFGSDPDNAGEITQIDKPPFVDDTGYISNNRYGSSADSVEMNWLETDMESRWASLILMIIGWMIIVKALAEYVTAKRRDRVIRVQATDRLELFMELDV
ncbi:hypothetical protein BGZ46_000125 [Entomortierella lignicola]|nr:hypothetical protein BGZ46_000125 [Entomortierella lignicola]